MQDRTGFLGAQPVLELGFVAACLFQRETIGFAVKRAIGALKRLDLGDPLAQVAIAHGNAKAAGFFLKRGDGDKLRQHGGVKARLLCLSKADRRAKLRFIGTDLVLQRAGIVVQPDLGLAHRPDAAHGAREVGHPKAAKAQDEQAHEDPDQ